MTFAVSEAPHILYNMVNPYRIVLRWDTRLSEHQLATIERTLIDIFGVEELDMSRYSATVVFAEHVLPPGRARSLVIEEITASESMQAALGPYTVG